MLKKYGEGSKKDFLNWEGIAKDYDAVHFDGNIPPYINTVDIESTAIFNPDAYEPVVLGTLEGLIKQIFHLLLANYTNLGTKEEILVLQFFIWESI